MKLTSIMETKITTRYTASEAKVRDQMEKELHQRIKYAMKFGDEFDADGAVKDLLKRYDEHSEFFKRCGSEEMKIYYRDKRFKEVWDVLYKRFGEEVADVFSNLLMKRYD